MELENLQYPEVWKTALGARLLHFTGEVTEKKGMSSFSTTTFFVNVPMRDEI